jgi:hypothetical protein
MAADQPEFKQKDEEDIRNNESDTEPAQDQDADRVNQERYKV